MGSRKGVDARIFAVLAAALVVLFGLAVWLWLAGREPGDGSVEAGFARDMSVHHAQAVEMAEIVRDRTEDSEMRTLAKDVALTQQAQIGQMRGWLAVWGLPPTGTEPAMTWMGMPTEGRMPGMATQEEINRLRELPPGEADKRFLQLMIPHHRAALDMAGAVLERTGQPEVVGLATAIKNSQESEIAAMQQMLRDMGGKAPEDASGGMDSMPGMQQENEGGDGE